MTAPRDLDDDFRGDGWHAPEHAWQAEVDAFASEFDLSEVARRQLHELCAASNATDASGWTWEHVAERLDLVTREFPALDPEAPQIVGAAALWLGRIGRADLAATLEGEKPARIAAMRDRAHWSPVKRITVRMRTDGVRLGDPAAVRAAMARYRGSR